MKSSSELLENATMETASQRRRRKLIALCDLHGLTEVAKKAHLNAATIYQIIKGIKLPRKKNGSRSERALGDVAARSIESAFGLGNAWFDADDDTGAFRATGTTASTGSAALAPGEPIPAAGDHALRTALARIAEKMRGEDQTKREMVALLMRDIAVRPEALETTLSNLFQMIGLPSARRRPTLAELAASMKPNPASTAPNVHPIGESEESDAVGLSKTSEQKELYRAAVKQRRHQK